MRSFFNYFLHAVFPWVAGRNLPVSTNPLVKQVYIYDILLVWNLKIKINKQIKTLQRVIYFSHHWNFLLEAGLYLSVGRPGWFSGTSVIRLLKILIYLLHKIRISYFNFENAFTGCFFPQYTTNSQCSVFRPGHMPCPAHRMDGTWDGSFVPSNGFSSRLEDDCSMWWQLPTGRN